MSLSCCQILVSHRDADPAHFANQSSTQSRNNCSTGRCHWSTAGGCGQVLKYEHTDTFLFIGTTRISQESQNRSTDIGRGTIYRSDLNDQALDYKKKKGKKARATIFLTWSTHPHTGPAIQTYTVLSVCDQENRTMCKKHHDQIITFSWLYTVLTRQVAVWRSSPWQK